MRVLVLGITGMLGHAVWLSLSDSHETYGFNRGSRDGLRGKCPLFKKNEGHILGNIDIFNDDDMRKALDIAAPKVIVNCVGIVKQLPDANHPVTAISLNALFPHRLAEICAGRHIRLIHISTDCVFSGRKGNYVESDFPDADDLYGRTKYLGEVTESNCLTIRTSLVGRQLSGKAGLFEWFLSQKGKVCGYRKAVFSGLTTYALAEIIKTLIEEYPAFEGLYHISSKAINKYDLLNMLKNSLKLEVEIIPDDSVVIDRSLNSARFRELTHIYIPTWDEMIEDFAGRVPNYEKWRY